VLILIFIWLSQLYSHIICSWSKVDALEEICSSFESLQSVGTLCHDLCSSHHLKLDSCPNYEAHTGKELVFVGLLHNKRLVLKSRKIKASELTKQDMSLSKQELKHGLRAVIDSTFDNGRRFSIYDLVPWNYNLPKEKETNEDSDYFDPNDNFNYTALHNLWLLVQDNEYILSKVLGDSKLTRDNLVFPKIEGTCGHLYGVTYLDNVLSIEMTVKDSLHYKPWNERLNLTLALIRFLLKIEAINVGLELCDVKFEHFGLSQSDLLMIDSDMIYKKLTVTEAIQSIQGCKVHSDCDFIDCKGKCIDSPSLPNKICQPNFEEDNNLVRICRNMLFANNSIHSNMGLLSNMPHALSEDIEEINELCSSFKNRILLRPILRDLSAKLNLLLPSNTHSFG
jgi:PREDICTED: hypothetical protein